MRIGAPAASWFESNPEQARQPAPGTHRPWLEPAVVILLLLLQLPFLPVAFRVDEPNIIALARQIERDPGDPYGFEINWTGTTKPAYEVLANPPVYPAWLALWGKLFGWSEISLHASNVPFAVLALMSFMAAARRLRISPALSGLLLLGSPAFLLATHVVMPDLAMLSCFLLALAGSMSTSGMWTSRPRTAGILVAVAFIGAFLAPLMKYNGVLLAPVLLVLWFFSGRRKETLLVALAPILSFALWGWASWQMYGTSHFDALSALQGGPRTYVVTGVLSALGLGVIPMALAFTRTTLPSPLAHWRASLLVFLGAAIVGLSVLRYPIRPAVLFGLSVAISLHLLVVMLMEIEPALRRSDGVTVLLVAWIFVVLVFQFRLLFTSVRYILPLLPAVILFLLYVSKERVLTRRFRLLVAMSIVVSLGVAIGDAAIANVYRRFIEKNEVRLRAGSGRLFFAGHWGFQYYAESIGAIAIEGVTEPQYVPGDKVMIARNPFPQILAPSPRRMNWSREDSEQRILWPARTIDCESAANFYGNAIGPCRFHGTASLPFGLSGEPADMISVFDAVGPRKGWR